MDRREPVIRHLFTGLFRQRPEASAAIPPMIDTTSSPTGRRGWPSSSSWQRLQPLEPTLLLTDSLETLRTFAELRRHELALPEGVRARTRRRARASATWMPSLRNEVASR
jgi:hypothetical protein